MRTSLNFFCHFALIDLKSFQLTFDCRTMNNNRPAFAENDRNVFTTEMLSFIKVFQVFGLFPLSTNPTLNSLLQIHTLINLLVVVGIFVSAFFIFPVLNESGEDSIED